MSDDVNDKYKAVSDEYKAAMAALEDSPGQRVMKFLWLQFGAVSLGIAAAIVICIPVAALGWVRTLF